MADIKISQLGAAITVGDTDLVPIVSGGNTLKATAAQVKEHSIGSTNISSLGDGSVTGAISALNTDKQPKTLDTPLTIGGVSKTTVEAALDGLNSESQSLSTALTNVEDDLTSIKQTGTTASQAIAKGTYFYLNGILVKAKTAIASGATFTLNTNYIVVLDGGLNDIVSNTNRTIGAYDDFLSATLSSPYVCPTNGYAQVTASTSTIGTTVEIHSADNIACYTRAISGGSGAVGVALMYCKKGMKIYSVGAATARFFKFED